MRESTDMTVAKGRKIRLRGQWRAHCEGVQKKRKTASTITRCRRPPPCLSQPCHVFCFRRVLFCRCQWRPATCLLSTSAVLGCLPSTPATMAPSASAWHLISLCPLEHALYLDVCFLSTSICQVDVLRHPTQPILHELNEFYAPHSL